VLRWSRFVQGDIDQYMKNVQAFTAKYGIEVRVDSESWKMCARRRRSRATPALDRTHSRHVDDANLIPKKLVDVTDLLQLLGKKYGGWYPTCELYLKPDGKRWIGVALGATGSMMVYRESQVKQRDSKLSETRQLPQDDEALKEKGTPAASRSATPPRRNTWCHWAGMDLRGKLVDEKNNVAINSRKAEGARVLEGALRHLIPGTLSWLDPNNNKPSSTGRSR